MNVAILLAQILFPIAAGMLVAERQFFRKHVRRLIFTGVSLAVSVVLMILSLFTEKTTITLFRLTGNISVVLSNDGLSRIFCMIVTIVWMAAGFYSFTYLKKTGRTNLFYASFLISEGVLQAIAMSGNLVTFYMFFEWMTLMTFPLVLQTRTKEAVRAARKYFFYSIAGASMCLLGIFLLAGNTDGLSFGGGLTSDANMTEVLIASLCLMFGFGTKAGMFPMHAWLPVAHPAAPAPASAVLSGVITKVGVLGIIRTFYYVIGVKNLEGTYVQYVFLCVSLLTVFMGSMLAYKEKVLKKRLAYSTVSQVSYILFGVALMTPLGLAAGIFHMIAHSLIKTALFLFAGSVIHETGKDRVEGLKGIGKLMPVTLWCFTVASLGLIGIPPTIGFASKWYLATEAMNTGIGAFRFVGPAILLVSALLTAGYLLPITADGFYPGKDFEFVLDEKHEKEFKKEAGGFMLVPILVFAVAIVVLGVLATPLHSFLTDALSDVFGTFC